MLFALYRLKKKMFSAFSRILRPYFPARSISFTLRSFQLSLVGFFFVNFLFIFFFLSIYILIRLVLFKHLIGINLFSFIRLRVCVFVLSVATFLYEKLNKIESKTQNK